VSKKSRFKGSDFFNGTSIQQKKKKMTQNKPQESQELVNDLLQRCPTE
jgi:hypothetical protein